MNDQAVYFWLLLLSAFIISVLTSFFVRATKRRPSLRPIAGYGVIPHLVDASIEMNRPLHLSIGSASIGQESTLAALASLSVIYDIIDRQAFTGHLPFVTVTDPVSLAITQDTVRRAFVAHDNFNKYRSSAIAWFPQTQHSVAFGAGASSMAVDRKASGHVLVGEFTNEIAFFGEASARYNQFMVGHSTKLEGQAIAFAQSKAPLIGEELFVGGAYLSSGKSFEIGGVFAIDILRWVVIAAIIIIAISNA